MEKNCIECQVNPKIPGSGQRFCSDLCRNKAKARRKKPSREEVRARAERRRREAGAKKRLPTWNDQGQRLCPRCTHYVDLECFKQGYCLICLSNQRFESKLRIKYHLTLDQYYAILAKQRGACAICLRKDQALQVDHDHSCCPTEKTCGKCVRGLLCKQCNYNLLGLVNDDANRLRRAADYLDRGSSSVPSLGEDSEAQQEYDYYRED